MVNIVLKNKSVTFDSLVFLVTEGFRDTVKNYG